MVVNKGGGSGAEGYTYEKGMAGDPYHLVFGTSNTWQQPMVSKVAFKQTDFTPIAAMVQDEFLLWVKQDGPKDVKDYIEAMKAKSGEAKMGGAQSKDTDELLTRMIEKTAGLKMIYVPFKSGAEAAVQLAGGHVDSHVNNPSESVGQWKGGTQRPLCVFNTKRLAAGPKITATEGWSDIPTCVEAGLNIPLFQQPRTVWLPLKVTPEQIAFYVDLMKKVQATPEWKDYIEKSSQTQVFLTGDGVHRLHGAGHRARAQGRRGAGLAGQVSRLRCSRDARSRALTAAITGAFGIAVVVSEPGQRHRLVVSRCRVRDLSLHDRPDRRRRQPVQPRRAAGCAAARSWSPPSSSSATVALFLPAVGLCRADSAARHVRRVGGSICCARCGCRTACRCCARRSSPGGLGRPLPRVRMELPGGVAARPARRLAGALSRWQNFELLMHGFSIAISVPHIALMIGGVLLGILVGVLPGLGAPNGVSLLLPITFGMQPVSAIILLSSIYWGALFGGSVTSILFNIPGEPSSVATTFDGYPMARSGRPTQALATAFGSAAFGALVGVVLITCLASWIARRRAGVRPGRVFRRLFPRLLELHRRGRLAAR